MIDNILSGFGSILAIGPILGIILGVDRVLDMCRTMVNVWGDSVGAKIITRIAPDPPTATISGT